MKKTNLTTFDSALVADNQNFRIQTEEYLKELVTNKIVIHPLMDLHGNNENGRDSAIIVLEGSGSIDINNQRVSFVHGDIVFVKADEKFRIINDSLNSDIIVLSVFAAKKPK